MKYTKQFTKYYPVFIASIIGGVLLLFIHMLIFQNLEANKILVTSTMPEKQAQEYLFPESLVSSDDYMTQYFTPAYPNMVSFKIRFAFSNLDILGAKPPIIRLTLRDAKQNILKKEEISSSEIVNWGYYTFELDNTLEQSEIYSITLEQIDGYIDESTGKYPTSYIPFIEYRDNNKFILKESIKSEHGGIIKDYEWNIVYTYRILDNNKIAFLLFTDLLGIFLFISFIKHKYYKEITFTLVLLVVSPILNFILIESIVGNILKTNHTYILLNLLFYYFILGLFLLFFKSTRIALLVNHGFMTMIALVEYYVYKLRGRSFMLQDIKSLQTATSVMGAYSFDIEILVGIALIITVFLFFIIILIPNLKYRQNLWKRRLGVVIICILLGLGFGSHKFIRHFPAFSLEIYDIEVNYQRKGFLITLLSEAQFLKFEAPEGYSADVVAENVISIKENSKNGKISEIQPSNLIVIMNESWADFRYISEFEYQDNITPYIDNLSRNVIKGFLHVPVFGGGTANSEYEFLTGNSMQLLDPASSAYQLNISDPEWGISSTLKQQGYQTLAFHPNYALNWNRNTVYPKMKFDNFFSIENWPLDGFETVRWGMSDAYCYETIIDQYQNKNKGEKLFSFLVTMQNHGGYDWEDFKSTVNFSYEEEFPLTEQYLSLIRETDKAFAYLVEFFEKVKEPTMIVMFGDHLPNVETSFYEYLLDKDWDDIPLEEEQKLYVTPYIIWTNYNIPQMEGIEISSNYLGSYVLQLAGLELTDYNKCLLNFMEEIPVIGIGMVMDSEGNWYKVEEMPESLENIYQQYNMLQYNNIFGDKKRIDSIFNLIE